MNLSHSVVRCAVFASLAAISLCVVADEQPKRGSNGDGTIQTIEQLRDEIKQSYADDAGKNGRFKALALLERNDGPVIALWVTPKNERVASFKCATTAFPGAFVKELGINILTGGPWKSVELSLKSLPMHKELRCVDLSFAEVRDTDLVHLAKCTKLRSIALHFTRITPRGIEQLRHLGELRHLGLVGVELADKDLADLQKALPRLKIERSQLRRVDLLPKQ